jgi:hypothetical protein
MDYLEEARVAVETSHKCEAIYLRTAPVRETLRDKSTWEGNVEVFLIIGHPKAKRCFVWGYPNEERGGKFDFVTMLGLLTVTSPETAVRAAMAAAIKQAKG